MINIDLNTSSEVEIKLITLQRRNKKHKDFIYNCHMHNVNLHYYISTDIRNPIFLSVCEKLNYGNY